MGSFIKGTRSVVLILILLLSVTAIYTSTPTRSAVSYVVLIDLAHGESAKGLDVFAKTHMMLRSMFCSPPRRI